MMADHIAFVSSSEDCKIFGRLYSDAALARVPLGRRQEIAGRLPHKTGLWVDAAIDSLHHWQVRGENKYNDHVKQFTAHEKIGDPEFQRSADKEKELVKNFVNSVMDDCVKLGAPDWLSIPQLPVVSDPSRNRINRLLAHFAGEWRAKGKFNGKLILPIIFTNQNQVKGKTQRNKTLSLAGKCYDDAGADGAWVADSSLNDQDGSGPLVKRLHGLIDFHKELNGVLPSHAITIAGPYWGVNLILWARGLVRHPAIGLGKTYQYHVPGVRFFRGNEHIALPPLRRWATVGQPLHAWIGKVVPSLPREDRAYAELESIQRNYSRIMMDPRSQVAEFYKEWLKELALIPSSGRALGLFHHFSSAYVLGKTLAEPLPSAEKTARAPGRVAEQLMLSCL
jgi:hypothetical protein